VKALKKTLWIRVGYVTMVAIIVVSAVYICDEIALQHTILGELSAVVDGGTGWEKAGDALVGRGKIALLYALQQLQQDPASYADYRLAQACDKLGGRYRAPLSAKEKQNEKGGVRKLIADARKALMDYADGRRTAWAAGEAALLKTFADVLESVPYAEFDGRRAAGIIRSAAAGEALAPDDAAYLRQTLDVPVERIELCLAGAAMTLLPIEKTFYLDAAAYVDQQALKLQARRLLLDVRSGLASRLEGGKISFTPSERGMLAMAAGLAEGAQEAKFDASRTVAISQKLALAENVPAEDAAYLKENLANVTDWLDRQVADCDAGILPAEVTDWCRRQTATLAEQLLAFASTGLRKMAEQGKAPLTPKERKHLKAAASEDEFAGRIPPAKLDGYLADNPVEFTPAEKEALLQVADAYHARHEAAEARLSGLVVRFAKRMRESGERFGAYPVLDDPAISATAGVADIIKSLWKKTDDRIMILDMVTISGTTNQRVRQDMEDALVVIGGAAVPNLIRSVEREKVDQALAADTAQRTKDERLRELNYANRIVRLTSISALGRIGDKQAADLLVRIADDKDPELATSAAKALGMLH